jgi:hypothetical protein
MTIRSIRLTSHSNTEYANIGCGKLAGRKENGGGRVGTSHIRTQQHDHRTIAISSLVKLFPSLHISRHSHLPHPPSQHLLSRFQTEAAIVQPTYSTHRN